MSDNDPFLSKPGDQTPATPATPPPAPGMIPGATAPPAATPPPGTIPGAAGPVPSYGAASQVPMSRSGEPLEKPRSLANALTWIAAAYTAVVIILALVAQSDVDATIEMAETGELTFGTGTLVSLLSFPLTIAAFIVYGMWMTRMRRNREALGTRVGLGGIEWWGWLIPLANAVLVPLGARRIAGRTTSMGVLLGWWITWALASVLSGIASSAIQLSVDLTTGDITNPDLLDAYPGLMWASAACTVVSWVLFRSFIRQATDRHLDPQA